MRLVHFEEIDSTNRELLQGEYANGTIAYSFRQLQGRGRLERSWQTIEAKDLAFSIVFVECETPAVWVTSMLSVALVELLANYKINAWIKWPNDVFVNESKIAGVLTEAQWQGNRLAKIVSGIGVNINSSQDDFLKFNRKITSISLENGMMYDKVKVLKDYVEEVEKLLNRSGKPSVSSIKKKWLEHSKVIGRRAEVIIPNEEPFEAVVKHIDDDGFLHVSAFGKSMVRIVTGDVNIIK